MAVSLHNYSLQSLPSPRLYANSICVSTASSSISVSLNPARCFNFKTLALCYLSCPHPLHCHKPLTRFSVSNSSLTNRSRNPEFTRCLAAQDSAPSTNGEVKGNQTVISEDEADGIYQSSMTTLLEVYKEAIQVGDLRTLSAIEEKILTIDKERNELIQKISSLTLEITSEKQKCLRLQADFHNFRKRTEKEQINARSSAQVEVFRDLLPVVDSFERGKKQIKPETEKEKKIDVSYQGIYKQFVETLRSLQVSVIATVGKPFDPSLHEAIAREESQVFKEGIVTHEIRRGFMLRDQLLRPAMVKVSSGPGSKKAKVPADNPTGQQATAVGVEEL